MSDLPPSPMRRSRMVDRDLRYRSAPLLKCWALVRAHRESQADSTLRVRLGHKRARTGATRARQCNALWRALIYVATTRTNRAAFAIWTERIAVTATVTNERHVRFVHARWLNQVKPGIVSKLQARLWRQ